MKNNWETEIINFKLKIFIRAVLKRLLELRAKIAGKRFFCNALAGASGYNICINSDMTVSCNCQDYDGSGHIGDLSVNSFAEIFGGTVAKSFRHNLAEGKLPILTCARCSELCWISKNEANHYEHYYRLPQSIMVENTVNCNLKCIGCGRKIVTKTRRKKSLNIEDIKKISLLIKEQQIKSVSYFNLGDPFISPGIYEELKIIRNNNPDVHISLTTNGSLLDTDTKREAALMLNHIGFSIHGASDKALRRYQRVGNFESAYINMKNLVDYRNSKGLNTPTIAWKYLLFNWNDRKEMILEAVQLAEQAGIDSISFEPTMSPVYGISWRYYFDSFFQTLGHKTWRGREIHF